MYEASDLFETAIAQKNRELSIRCTINSVVYSDSNIKSCSVEESILTGEDFKFGSATSSNATIILINIDGSMSASSFEEKEVLVEIGIKVDKFGSPVEYSALGTYIVETGTKDLTTITLICVDKMIYFEKPYVSNLTYPSTLGQILQEVCDQAGVTLVTTAFLNSDFVVNSEPDYSNVTLRNALEFISELACSFACINRDGNLELFTLTETDIVINRDNYYSMNLSEYTYGPIDHVAINNDGVITESGTGENTYTISGNVFALYPTQSLVDNIYQAVENFSFKPFTCVWQGNVLVTAGDIVTVNYNDGPDYKSFVANQKFTYETGLKCEITTNARTDLRKDYASGGIILGEISKVRSEFKSEISQTNEQISLKVSQTDFDSLEGRVSSAESSITINSNNIALKVSSTDYNGNTIASLINQSDTTIEIDASKINLQGYVTISSLDTPGSVTIDGGNIKADSISGDAIYGGMITGANWLSTGTGTPFQVFIGTTDYAAMDVYNGSLSLMYDGTEYARLSYDPMSWNNLKINKSIIVPYAFYSQNGNGFGYFKYDDSSYFRIGTSGASVYVNGTSKATWSSMPKTRLEPSGDGILDGLEFGANNPASMQPTLTDYFMNVSVNGEKQIDLDEKFLQFVSSWDIFMSAGNSITLKEKGTTYVILEGTGTVSFFVVGIQKGKEDLVGYNFEEKTDEDGAIYRDFAERRLTR